MDFQRIFLFSSTINTTGGYYLNNQCITSRSLFFWNWKYNFYSRSWQTLSCTIKTCQTCMYNTMRIHSNTDVGLHVKWLGHKMMAVVLNIIQRENSCIWPQILQYHIRIPLFIATQHQPIEIIKGIHELNFLMFSL